ncbi:MAG: helix-turn-helix transcriptional regulator [Mucilaginibacter polytrichastri]|nr:helix-turn-helix transcriptional regulator [Mucilaginibacter polytrichastri]
MKHVLPSGLIDDHGEFFVHTCGEAVSMLKGGVALPFESFCSATLEMIDDDMAAHPTKVVALQEMGYAEQTDQRQKYIACLYGVLDGTPDVVDGRLMECEYVQCAKRGACIGEGRLCNALRLPTGDHLTKREVEILVLVAGGYLNKEIAGMLGISELTVKQHNTNIQKKGGFYRKGEMIRFAFEHKLL